MSHFGPKFESQRRFLISHIYTCMVCPKQNLSDCPSGTDSVSYPRFRYTVVRESTVVSRVRLRSLVHIIWLATTSTEHWRRSEIRRSLKRSSQLWVQRSRTIHWQHRPQSLRLSWNMFQTEDEKRGLSFSGRRSPSSPLEG